MKIRERERVEEQPDKRVRATTIEYGEIPKERIKSGIRPDPSRSDPSSFIAGTKKQIARVGGGGGG
jgi:hypothetical protein